MKFFLKITFPSSNDYNFGPFKFMTNNLLQKGGTTPHLRLALRSPALGLYTHVAIHILWVGLNGLCYFLR